MLHGPRMGGDRRGGGAQRKGEVQGGLVGDVQSRKGKESAFVVSVVVTSVVFAGVIVAAVVASLGAFKFR